MERNEEKAKKYYYVCISTFLNGYINAPKEQLQWMNKEEIFKNRCAFSLSHYLRSDVGLWSSHF